MIPSGSAKPAARRRVLRAETIGILILVMLGFAVVLVRYGHFLDWHAR
jgi:hypothetical protein